MARSRDWDKTRRQRKMSSASPENPRLERRADAYLAAVDRRQAEQRPKRRQK